MNNEHTPEDVINETPRDDSQLEFSFEDEVAKETQNSDDNFGIFDIIRMIVCATCFIVVILSFVFRTSIVDGDSMYPTLTNRDMLITSNLFYTPEQGDIVIFEHSNYPSSLVKRVIATENQTIDIDKNGRVYVDGEMLPEAYANISGFYIDSRTAVSLPYTVPNDHVFVMGDNRNKSEDSRWFGAINEQQILGKVYFRLIGGFGTVD